MPRSAAEIIRKHQAEETAKASRSQSKASKNVETTIEYPKGFGLFGWVARFFQTASERKAELQTKRDELKHTKDIVDRVLVGSGLFQEMEDIKRTHIDRKFPNSELFVNYFESGAQVVLAWGDGFAVSKDHKSGNSSIDNNEYYNYRLIAITIDPKNNGTFDVDNQHFSSQDFPIGRERLNYALARAFLNSYVRANQPFIDLTPGNPEVGYGRP